MKLVGKLLIGVIMGLTPGVLVLNALSGLWLARIEGMDTLNPKP